MLGFPSCCGPHGCLKNRLETAYPIRIHCDMLVSGKQVLLIETLELLGHWFPLGLGQSKVLLVW